MLILSKFLLYIYADNCEQKCQVIFEKMYFSY